MLSIEDLESLEETLEILSDRQLMDEIREGRAQLAAGKGEVLTRDEVLAQVRPE
jgi:PHD/YefM family antitoxin component YafN of YafNO toxin-antitoxin module